MRDAARCDGPVIPVSVYLAARFRFEDDRIAELWDLAQEVPAETPNTNGMF